jgi:hypothetical protein
MKILHAFLGAAALAGAFGLNASQAQATQILVGQCVEYVTCWTSGTPTAWSDTLSMAQVDSLASGDLVVTQTAQYVIRLGVTTADFSTTTGAVFETLPEFSGPGSYSDPGPFPTDLLVGTFTIPGNATGLTVSGYFGNSMSTNSSGANVCLGDGPCASGVPETSTWAMMLAGFAGLGVLGYRASRKSLAVAA